MAELLSWTESLCPYCLRRVPARRVVEDDAVYLEKKCSVHGELARALLWRNGPRVYGEWSRFGGKTAKGPKRYLTSTAHGCPYDCGLCANHKQDTCSAILEVTQQCNLCCPVCFSAAKKPIAVDPDLSRIAQMLQSLLDCGGPYPIQLSGGEPTLRDDLPQIVALARKKGYEHVQINTNGLRLARDNDYGQALKDAGTTTVFLQFDGVTDDVYKQIRGTALLSLKLRAIERCSQLKIGVILVPTLIRKLNDHQVGSIIQLAKKWIPTVKGVHFQPMTYLGRYPRAPANEDRILIPDLLGAIDKQTGGELKVDNLVPPG